MSEITVRAAQTADEEALLALAEVEMRSHEAMDERFRVRDDARERYAVYLRNRMRDIDSTVFVALIDGGIVGLAIGSIRKQNGFFQVQRYGYVSDLMVSSSARRGGVGRTLFERIVLWLRGLGIEVVRLHIATRSDEARAFWRSLGAEDFLTEAWIDIHRAVGPSGTSARLAADPTEAPSPEGASSSGSSASKPAGPRRNSGHEFLGDALLGGPEGGP